TRWDAGLDVGRTPVGALVQQAFTYPFVGERGRWAFRQAFQLNEHYFEYVSRDGDDGLQRIWFPERRVAADVGIALRLGHEQFSRTVVGAAIAGEWVTYPEDPLPRFAEPELADS